MAVRKTTASDAVSRVLDKIPAEQILNPQPLFLQVGRDRYEILPMPDSALMVIGDTLAQTAGFVEQIARMGLGKGSLDITEIIGLAPMIGPELVCLLVPNATKIIAACLRKDESWVQDNLRVHQRLEALKLILEAEHLPTILSVFTELVTMFQTSLPAQAETSLETTTGATEDRWDRATLYELFSHEYHWTDDHIATMSYLKQHLYLTRYIRRKMREARTHEDAGQSTGVSAAFSGPPAKELSGNDFQAFFGN